MADGGYLLVALFAGVGMWAGAVLAWLFWI